MAMSGRKPIASVVKLVTGRPGRRKPRASEPAPDGKPTPPVPLHGRPAALWRRFIARAWWLVAADSQKAYMWAHMAAEFEADPRAMTAARISQLRALGSELGLDPASRARLDCGKKPGEPDPFAAFYSG